MDGEYGYLTAYKPSRRPILRKKIRFEAGKIILVLYGVTIANLPIYQRSSPPFIVRIQDA
jgi:hypothetical protein